MSIKYTLWDCRTGLKMIMQNIWCFLARPCSSCLTFHHIHFKLKINQRQNWTSRKHLVDQETTSKYEWLIDSRPILWEIFCPSKNLWKLTRGGWLISSRPIRDSSRASYPRTGSTHAKYPGSIFPLLPFMLLPPPTPSLNTPSLGSNSACAQNLILRLYQLKPKFSIFNI